MNSDEFYEYEDRAYINPTLSSGEQESFIDNLRNIQSQNNAQIAQQTYNLGTQVPSNLGGLGGGEAYFTSRYQTPQVGEMVNTLKTAAQAQALQDVMSNYQAQLKQKYQNEYKKAQKRAAARARSYGGGYGYYPTGYDTTGSEDGLDITTNGTKSGGFWDTTIGKMTNKWIGDVLEGGTINQNTSGVNAKTYENAPLSLMGVMSGGSGNLGLWPNGTKMTEGSTYSWGGNTYTIKPGLSGNPYDIVKVN